MQQDNKINWNKRVVTYERSMKLYTQLADVISDYFHCSIDKVIMFDRHNWDEYKHVLLVATIAELTDRRLDDIISVLTNRMNVNGNRVTEALIKTYVLHYKTVMWHNDGLELDIKTMAAHFRERLIKLRA